MACESCECTKNNSGITRRGFLWSAWALLCVTAGSTALATIRFMFPNTLNEPTKIRKVGLPENYKASGVYDTFLKEFGVFVVKEEGQIYALLATCTHLGCTPRWMPDKKEFVCPCHGSKYHQNGVNFAGPAPRPLDRVRISLSEDGQILLDKAQLFVRDLSKGKDEWGKSEAYLEV